MLNVNAPEWHPAVVESPAAVPQDVDPSSTVANRGGQKGPPVRGRWQCQSRSKRRSRSRSSSGSAPFQGRRLRGGKQQIPTGQGFDICSAEWRRVAENSSQRGSAVEPRGSESVLDDAGKEMWPALQTAQWDRVQPTKPLRSVEVGGPRPCNAEEEDDAVFYVSSVALAGADTSVLVAQFSSLECVCVKWLDRNSALVFIPELSLRAAVASLGDHRRTSGAATFGIVTLSELRRAMNAPGRAPVLDFQNKPCTLLRLPLAGELSFLLDQIVHSTRHTPPPPPLQAGMGVDGSSSQCPPPPAPGGSPSTPLEAQQAAEADARPDVGHSLLLELAGALPHVVGALWPARRVVAALRTCTALRGCLQAHARAATLECGPGAADRERGGFEGAGRRAMAAMEVDEDGEDRQGEWGGERVRRAVPSAREVDAMVSGLGCPGVSLSVRSRHSAATSRAVLLGLHKATQAGWTGALQVLDLSHSQCDLSTVRRAGQEASELEALLAVVLAQGCSLRRLNLRENWGGAEGAALMGEALAGCSGLSSLDLSFCRLGEGTGEVLAGLRGCSSLQEMRLAGNQMGDAGSRQLASSLVSWPHLRQLDVSCNGLTGAGAEILTKALRASTMLVALAMGGNKLMGGEGAMWLAVAMGSCLHVHTLDLSGNVMGEEGMQALGGALMGCKLLQRLELGGNAIGAGGAREVRAVLQASGARLKRLGLRANHIGGGDGARQLARGLEGCSSLTSLDLGSNGFGPLGSAEVVSALGGQASLLVELGLRHNALGRKGVRVWQSVLTQFTALSDLDLSYNELRGEGASKLVEGLRFCGKLRRLDLERNLIGGREAVKLAGMLQPLHELESLNLQGNLLREEGGARLDNGIWGCGGMRPARGGNREDVLEQLRDTLPRCRIMI